MKKLLLLLLFIPLVSFGQQTVIIADGKLSESLMQNSINDTNSAGRFYIGDGKYKIITVGKSSLVSIKKIRTSINLLRPPDTSDTRRCGTAFKPYSPSSLSPSSPRCRQRSSMSVTLRSARVASTTGSSMRPRRRRPILLMFPLA